MEVPGPPLSEQDARKYFIDVVLGIEYCKLSQINFAFFNVQMKSHLSITQIL